MTPSFAFERVLQQCITDINHWMSANRLSWTWTWTKLNLSGLVRRRVFVFLPCSLLLTLFIRVSTSEYWKLSSQPTSASRNTSRRSARPASTILAQYVYASLSTRNYSTVSRGTLHPSLCDCLKTSSSFCCQSSVCCAVLPTEFIRTSGFLCRWPDNIELTTETSAWSYSHHRPYLFLDDYLRHFSFQSTNVCSALKAFDVDALYKFTFYFILLLLYSTILSMYK